MECYESKEVVDLNPERFCVQRSFNIVCSYIYSHCVEKKAYRFRKKFEWSDLMKKALKKGSDIHEIKKNIIDSQQEFQIIQLSSLSFQKWYVGFQELYSKVNLFSLMQVFHGL